MFIITLYSFLLSIGKVCLDPDLGWHLFLGKSMLEKRSLIENHLGYNHQLSNIPTIDHEWLSDILLYLSFHKFGYAFLALVFLIIFIIAFYCLHLVLKSRGVSPGAAFIALLFVFFPTTALYGVRLQLLTWLGATLMLLVRSKIVSRKIRYLVYFFLFAIGNNFHGGYLTLAIIPLLLEIEWQKTIKGLIKRNFANISILGLILLLAISLNPNGLGYWKLALDMILNRSYLKGIQEWLPIYAIPPLYFAEFIWPLATLTFVLTINSFWKKVKPNELILVVLLGYLGIQSRRNFPVFMIVAAPVFGLAIDHFISETAGKMKGEALTIAGSIIAILLGLFILTNIPAQNYSLSFIQNPWSDQNNYPVGATKYLEDHPDSTTNLFNPYEWGGYLIWRIPGLKVFIDGRGPQTKIPGKGITLLDEYFRFFSADPTIIRQNLEEYNISTVLLHKQQILAFDPVTRAIIGFASPKELASYENKRDYLLEYMSKESGWRKVYEDKISIIFERD